MAKIITPETKDAALKLALIEKGRELIELCGDRIPEGGHVSIIAWPDHISADIYRPGSGGSELHAWSSDDPDSGTEVWE